MSFLFDVALTFKISIILSGVYYRCNAQKNQDKLSFYIWSIGQNYNKIWNPAPIFSGKKLLCLEKKPVGGCSVHSLQADGGFIVGHPNEENVKMTSIFKLQNASSTKEYYNFALAGWLYV